MNKIEEIRAEYIKRHQQFRTKTDNIYIEIARLQSELKNIRCPNWIDMISKPIAEIMFEKLPARRFEILGPFGICARTSIHFYRKGVPEKKKFEGNNCLSICFEPGNLGKDEIEIRVVDEKTDTGRYARQTVGEMNGMNHPTQTMVNNVNWLLDWMRKQYGIKEGVAL